MSSTLKPSNQPPLWLAFGAGGMLSALIGAVLVFITGIGAPLGFFGLDTVMSYSNVLAFARNPLGGLFILAVISLFLWHAAHRIYHTMHDFGIHGNVVLWLACYGVALAATVSCAYALLRL